MRVLLTHKETKKHILVDDAESIKALLESDLIYCGKKCSTLEIFGRVEGEQKTTTVNTLEWELDVCVG